MRTTGIAYLILSIFLLCSFTTDPDSISLTGHLKTKSKKNSATVDGIYICAKEGDNTVGETETDEEGNFTMDFERQDGGKTPISIFYVNERSDTVLLKKFAHFANETPEVTLYIQ